MMDSKTFSRCICQVMTYSLASRKLVDNTIDSDSGFESEGKSVVCLALDNQSIEALVSLHNTATTI